MADEALRTVRRPVPALERRHGGRQVDADGPVRGAARGQVVPLLRREVEVKARLHGEVALADEPFDLGLFRQKAEDGVVELACEVFAALGNAEVAGADGEGEEDLGGSHVGRAEREHGGDLSAVECLHGLVGAYEGPQAVRDAMRLQEVLQASADARSRADRDLKALPGREVAGGTGRVGADEEVVAARADRVGRQAEAVAVVHRVGEAAHEVQFAARQPVKRLVVGAVDGLDRPVAELRQRREVVQRRARVRTVRLPFAEPRLGEVGDAHARRCRQDERHGRERGQEEKGASHGAQFRRRCSVTWLPRSQPITRRLAPASTLNAASPAQPWTVLFSA